ncbi:MAG: metallophosphoesterase [Candidatus Thorarchaeota archaeon]
MIIAVADLHLGSPMANKSGFSDFIREFLEPNQDDISRIVLLGDILDLWRNSNSQVLLQNLDIMVLLGGLDMEKNFLVGNHDYAIFSLMKQGIFSVSADSTGLLDKVSESLELNYDGLDLKFVHGHQVDYWSALKFYEVFSQAMCFVDLEDQDLSDVWNIIYRFAEDLPEEIRMKVRQLPHETQMALEQKLSGPLEGNIDSEKSGKYHEWELLQKVSVLNDVANNSPESLLSVTQFAEAWGQLLKKIDQYSDSPFLPPAVEIEIHQMQRKAASLTIGLQDKQFLVRGHGHTPYVSQETKVTDAGCWLDSKGSYLRIEDGEVKVHQW